MLEDVYDEARRELSGWTKDTRAHLNLGELLDDRHCMFGGVSGTSSTVDGDLAGPKSSTGGGMEAIDLDVHLPPPPPDDDEGTAGGVGRECVVAWKPGHPGGK